MGYISVTDSIGRASVNLMLLAPKDAILFETTHSHGQSAMGSLKVTQGY